MRPETLTKSKSAALVGVILLSQFACSKGESSGPSQSLSGQASAPMASFTRASALDLSSLLSGSADGFARALTPRTFSFPRDHGSHPKFRTEWWYLTGNLEDLEGRQFGYQFTLFRNAITAENAHRTSSWATRQLYMGHFALTDVESGRFHAFERFARGAAGLAGVEQGPFRAWLEDWRLTGGESPPPFALSVEADGIGLALELVDRKPLVLQGEDGLSRKGREAGNASYYYAFTRLETTGRVCIGDTVVAVQGSSWLDREWSTSALESGQRGWDWLALQLDDGTELMVYQMRRNDGTPDSTSSGSLVDGAGSRHGLDRGDFRLDVLDWWTSPASGVRYPSLWQITVPDQDLELQVEPLLSDQELRLSIRYWEGAVRVEGQRKGEPVTGRGYVELTGYEPD